MQDYMRALRQRFYTPPGCEKLNRELGQVHGELHEALNGQERKLLLRIIDLESAIRDEASLQIFIAGFQLAEGIKQELTDQPPYSFDREEEKHAEELYIKEKEQEET